MSEPTIPPESTAHADPDCTAFKFVEARVGKSVDPNATIDCVAYMTTDRVDSDHEVVLPAGADLSRFEKNKVLLVGHAQGQPGCYYPLPVGRVVQTKVRTHGILASIVFARTSAMGREVKALFDEDMLRSFSIGFQSLEASLMTREEAHSRADWREAYEKAAGRILVHRRWKLLELSVAPIPCNEDALVVKYKALGRPVPDWIHCPAPASEAAIPAEAIADPDEAAAPPVKAKDRACALPPLSGALTYDQAVRALVASSASAILRATAEAEERLHGHV